jgi:PAS domain S-box-containing protein
MGEVISNDLAAAAAERRTDEPDLRKVIDSVPGLVCCVDRDCRYVLVNRGYSEWFGRPQSDFIGKTVVDILGEQTFELIKPHLERAFSGETAIFDRYHQYSAGPVKYVRTTLVPDRDPGGYVKGVVVFVEDISDRKRAEDAERELERQLTLLIEASGSLLASPGTQDVLRTILDLAKRFIEADAYSLWRNSGETWHMAAQDGLSERYNATASGSGKILAAKLPIVTEDVETDPFLQLRREIYKAEGIRSMITVPLHIHSEVAGTLVFYYRKKHRFSNLETRVASALGNLAAAAIGSAELYEREIRMRRLAEENEQRSAFLAEAGQILSSSLDFDQTLSTLVDLSVPRFADVAAVEVLDRSGEARRVALKHCNPDKLDFVKDFRRRFPPLADDMVQTAMRTGVSRLVEQIPDEVLVQRARSREHLEALRYFGIKSLILAPLIVNGRTFGLMTFVTAESERHYTQADLAFAEELARRAATAMDNARLFAESTEAQRALRVINAELSRANEDLNQFAYSASHDLQEPLRMLVIYSQLLSRRYASVLDEQANEYLGFIVDGARRMEMLLSDLLGYMQVVNMAQLPTAAIDPNPALQRVMDTLAGSITESQANIECDALPMLAVQEFHLIQLFQNLLSNSIKYRSERPPHVRITCSREDAFWKVCVQDNGIGVAPEYRDQVFKVFKRLHDKEKYPGTGIGLAICQKIVERYGGKIWVEDAPVQGLTVCILLPVAPGEPLNTEAKPPLPAADA